VSVSDAAAPVEVTTGHPGVWDVYRVEIKKLTAQTLTRLVALACLVGPFVFGGIIKTQTAVPADTLFGRWMHTSGYATPLVILGFAGVAGFPLLTSIVAGDIFAAEDRYGTWKTLLTRSSSRGDLFIGKTLAAATYSLAMVTLLAASSLAAGLLLVGSKSLVSLSGTSISPGRVLGLVGLSWAISLIPVLGFTSLGVLFSIASRNSIVGVLGPPVVGLLMILLTVLGGGVVVRTLLLTTPFDAWHGLLLAHPHYQPLERGAAVAAIYIFFALDVAWALFRRRDFAGSDPSRQGSWGLVIRWAAVAVAVVALLAAASNWGPTTITSEKLQASIAPTFKNLVTVQQMLLGRRAQAGASLTVRPLCRRGGQNRPSRGPGDDWICQLTVTSPGASEALVAYEVNARANGCYTATGPSPVVGPLKIPDARGRSVVNPLYQFDGCIEP
jgi:ABC-2 type transport system permease protein